MLVDISLVQDQLCRVAFTISHKGDLSIDDLQKIIAIAFRKDLKFRLAHGLREEMIALSRNSNNEIRRQLVPSDVAVE